jgi:hypothetical protein
MQYVIFRVFCKNDPLFIAVCTNKEQLEDVVLNKLDKYIGVKDHHCTIDKELFAIVEAKSGTPVKDICCISASSDYPDCVMLCDSLSILKKKIKGDYKSDDEEY